MVCIWAIMACFISMSLFMTSFMASMWVFMAASAASFLGMFSVMELFILAIGSEAETAGVTAGVSGVAVAVAAGVAVTVAAGAGVTMVVGAGVGVTVTAVAGAG